MALRIKIEERDIKKGVALQPNACAVAVAACRQLPGVTEAKAHLGCIYILRNGKWLRFRTPDGLRVEIIAYDRGGRFCGGMFELLPPPIKSVVNQARNSAGARRRAANGRRRPTIKRRKPHQVPNVRATAHKGDGAAPL